jgi:serine/threonine protein kinase/tetratricopeptide (TPR) repeat protein
MAVENKSLSEEALDQILAEYFEAVEAGQCPDRQDWLRRFPEAADALTDFFADQERFRQRVAPLRECLGGLVTEDCFPAAGTQVGHYELLEEIARGGMGIVFKARQVQLNRTVALKMILMGALATPAEQQRFRLEAESAARLDHPNIVPIYEIDTWQGQPYFSMRLVEGGSLADWLVSEQVPRGDWSALAQLLTTLARAVHHAHQRGILHRDLKPANILLQTDPTATGTLASALPLISDFGLAHWLHRDPASAAETVSLATLPTNPEETPPVADRLTHSGVAVGTPSYMAPEQVQTSERGPALTTATDVYSLGAILYELLTGQPPFRSANVRETLRCVVEQPPVPPRQKDPRVPGDLEAICLKCLEKEPARRYGSAAALAEDLERSLRGEPVEARPLGVLGRWGRWCRRQPALALSCALAVAGLVGVTVVSVLFAWSEARGRARLDEAAANLRKALIDAREHKQLAEENYRKAHQAIEEFYVRFGYEDGVRSARLHPIQKELLETALKHFQDFLKQKADDPALRIDVALTLGRIGHISSRLGSPGEGLNYYDRALELVTQLEKEGPPSTKVQRLAAMAHANRGNVLLTLGRQAEALQSVEEAVARYRVLHREGAQNREYAWRLVQVLNNLSEHYLQRNQLEIARGCVQEAQELLAPLLAGAPDVAVFQTEQARVVYYCGRICGMLGQDEEANRAFEQVCAIEEKLTRAYPQHEYHQRLLAVTSTRLARGRYSRGQVQEGWRLVQRSKSLLDKLVQSNPRDLEYLLEWARLQCTLGDFYRMGNDLEKAQQCYLEMVQRVEALPAEHQEMESFRFVRALAYWPLGKIALQLKDTGKALAYLERAAQLLNRLVQDNPTRVDYRCQLGEALLARGEALAAVSKPEEALASVRRAVTILSRNLADAPRAPEYAHGLLYAVRTLVKLQEEAGQPAEAIRCWQESQDLFARLVREHGEALDLRHCLAQALVDCSMTLRGQQRPKEAEAMLVKARPEWDKLVAVDPKKYLGGVVNWHLQFGHLAGSLGDLIEQVRHCEQARDLSEKLQALDDRSPMTPKDLDLVLRNLGRAYLRQNKLAQAEATLRELISSVRRALDTQPEKVELRLLLLTEYNELALVLCKANKFLEVVQVMVEEQQLTDQPKELVRIASVLGWCSNAVGKDKANLTPQEQAGRDHIADLAVQALQKAVACGLESVAEATRHPDFAAVRTRPGFKQLVQQQKKEL